MSWSNGYPVERNYGYVYAPQMVPSHLALVATQAGIRAPSNERFRYFELGCGFGLMSLLMATSNPHAEFWANDFMPSHVLEMRRLAEEAALDNVTCLEDSFEELLARDLPEFDFIGLHGVYSWISAENRSHIREFIKRRLKTGGLVYVSYNSLAGSAEMRPLRALMMSAAQTVGSPIERGMRSSFELVQKLAVVKARYFEEFPNAAAGLSRLQQTRPSFVLHDFFNRHWTAFLPSEVMAELENSKLSYVASARLLEDLGMLLSAEQIELLRHIPHRPLVEDVRDFCIKTHLRRDVFARGAGGLSADTRLERLLATRFALTVAPNECALTARGDGVEVTLLEHVHGQLLAALASGPHTIAELVALPSIMPLGQDAVVGGVLALAAVGYVAPAFTDPGLAERTERIQRLNTALLAQATTQRPVPCLCSALVGSGILVDVLDQLFIRASEEGSDLAEYAWDALRRAGQKVFRGGQPLESTNDSLAELRRSAAEFLRTDREFLAQHGILTRTDFAS